VAELRREHPDKVVELWAEDEARLGLKPMSRRAWAVRGRRPEACGRMKYRWLYVYGFAHPASGRNLELILPSANTDWMAVALAEFARWADPAGEKQLVLLVDNAGWHVARRLEVPPNVVLHRLPPCTPELQPVEPLWPLVREVAANRGYDDLESMQAPLVERCRWLMDQPQVVRGAVGFRWAAANG
jgi:hypothetical protein